MHVAHSNYSLAFTQGDSKRFRLMFPICLVALGYAQPDAKIRCNLQFDIAPYYKEQLIYDVKRHPFTFAFDERAPVHLSANSMMDMFNIGQTMNIGS